MDRGWDPVLGKLNIFFFFNGVEQGGTAITSGSIKEAGYFLQISKEAGLCVQLGQGD